MPMRAVRPIVLNCWTVCTASTMPTNRPVTITTRMLRVPISNICGSTRRMFLRLVQPAISQPMVRTENRHKSPKATALSSVRFPMPVTKSMTTVGVNLLTG